MAEKSKLNRPRAGTKAIFSERTELETCEV